MVHIEVPAVRYKELASKISGENSAAIRRRVKRARDVQLKRFQAKKNIFYNARIESKEIRHYCKIDEQAGSRAPSQICRFRRNSPRFCQ